MKNSISYNERSKKNIVTVALVLLYIHIVVHILLSTLCKLLIGPVQLCPSVIIPISIHCTQIDFLPSYAFDINKFTLIFKPPCSDNQQTVHRMKNHTTFTWRKRNLQVSFYTRPGLQCDFNYSLPASKQIVPAILLTITYATCRLSTRAESHSNHSANERTCRAFCYFHYI